MFYMLWNVFRMIVQNPILNDSAKYQALKIPLTAGTWPSLTWQQCLLGSILPRPLWHTTTMWSLFRGSVIWIAWLDKNAICFNNNTWPMQKLEQVIWEACVDHARIAWFKTTKLCKLYLDKEGVFLGKFEHTWLQSDFLGQRTQMKVC